MAYRAYGAIKDGQKPNVSQEPDDFDEDNSSNGIYSIEIFVYGDAPNVPFVNVAAWSEEDALAAFESVRTTLCSTSLWPREYALIHDHINVEGGDCYCNCKACTDLVTGDCICPECNCDGEGH